MSHNSAAIFTGLLCFGRVSFLRDVTDIALLPWIPGFHGNDIICLCVTSKLLCLVARTKNDSLELFNTAPRDGSISVVTVGICLCVTSVISFCERRVSVEQRVKVMAASPVTNTWLSIYSLSISPSVSLFCKSYNWFVSRVTPVTFSSKLSLH